MVLASGSFSLCLDALAVGFQWEREPLPLFNHVIGGSIPDCLGLKEFSLMSEGSIFTLPSQLGQDEFAS